jgi:hypothetical protein
VGSEKGAKCGTVFGNGGVIGAPGVHGGGGGGGARSGFQRKKTVGLTYRVGLHVSEVEATGQAGLERKGGGGPKLLLGLKSKRVKRKSILIDFWIKIGIEIE